MGECHLFKEERDVLEEETRPIDQCDMGKSGALDNNEKTIAIPREIWWPQPAKQEEDNVSKTFYVIHF